MALLGYLLTTEGIGASYAAKYADLLTSPLYGYKSNQVTFLRAHGGFDVKHFDEVKKFMDELDADDEPAERDLGGATLYDHVLLADVARFARRSQYQLR